MIRLTSTTPNIAYILGAYYLAATAFFSASEAATNELVAPNNVHCACLFDQLHFTCASAGGGSTIWNGSAFSCEANNNEIKLRHSVFGTSGTSGSCNNGTIVGQSLGIENNICYISQLIVNISEQLNGRDVRCDHNSNNELIHIGIAMLNVISVMNPHPPPTEVSLVEIDQGVATFTWSSDVNCSSIDYVITSDCGVCPSSTNSTTVTCSDLQLPNESSEILCSFNVSSRVCGIVGNHSTSILAVPVISVLNIIPQYSNESQVLKRLTFVTVNNTRTTKNDIFGSVTEYNVTYSTQSTSVVSSNISAESLFCKAEICTFTASVPSSICFASSDINVMVYVSASNRIGQGPSSDTVTIDCTNMIVCINFNSSTSIFSCVFLNELDNSVKSCSIAYGLCNQELTIKLEGYSTLENPNVVLLHLSGIEDQNYCYVVVASSNVSIIRLEGNFTKGSQNASTVNYITIAIAISVAVIVILCLTIIIFVTAMVYAVSYRQQQVIDPLQKLKLKLIDKHRVFETYIVNENCELRQFINKRKPELEVKFWRGHVYYELTNEKEDVYYYDGYKELILQKKDTEELFTPVNDKETLNEMGLLGEGISRPTSPIVSQYRVFVQSKGSGRRHLAKDTYLLYEENESCVMIQDNYQPLPVPEDYFVVHKINEDGTTIGNLFRKLKLEINKLNIFMELDQSQLNHDDIRDVLLMDKETEKLFTGPYVRSMIKEETELDHQKWRAFALRKSEYRFILKKGMIVVHENPENVTGTFRLLEVDEENARMSEFVRRKLRINEFERGRAYFEFIENENLPCCRKVIIKSVHACKEIKDFQELQTIQMFYSFSGAPGDEISPPELTNHKTFIHSPTLGSRCLKKGTLLLYRVKESEVDLPAQEHI